MTGKNACGGNAPFRIVTSFKIITSASESIQLPIKPDEPPSISGKQGSDRRYPILFPRPNLDI